MEYVMGYAVCFHLEEAFENKERLWLFASEFNSFHFGGLFEMRVCVHAGWEFWIQNELTV